MRGATEMIRGIEPAMREAWPHNREPILITWMRAFRHTEIFFPARGCTEDSTLLYKVGRVDDFTESN